MKWNRVQHLRLMGLLILIVIILDQLTKHLILKTIAPGQGISVIPGLFNLVLTFNKGSAFGLFAGLPDSVRITVLALAMLIALGVLLYLLLYDYYDNLIGQAAIAFILGGALGNNIDPFIKGNDKRNNQNDNDI